MSLIMACRTIYIGPTVQKVSFGGIMTNLAGILRAPQRDVEGKERPLNLHQVLSDVFKFWHWNMVFTKAPFLHLFQRNHKDGSQRWTSTGQGHHRSQRFSRALCP